MMSKKEKNKNFKVVYMAYGDTPTTTILKGKDVAQIEWFVNMYMNGETISVEEIKEE